MRNPTLAVFVAVALCAAGGAFAHDYALGDLKIGSPWALPSPPGAPTAAGFLTVSNTGKTPDRLLGAETPVAARVEIHSMSMDGPVMRMRPVIGGLAIAPGQTVTVSPGNYHLMLIGPKRPFTIGEHIPATLRFERAGRVKIEFEVMVAAPGPGPMDHAHMDMH